MQKNWRVVKILLIVKIRVFFIIILSNKEPKNSVSFKKAYEIKFLFV